MTLLSNLENVAAIPDRGELDYSTAVSLLEPHWLTPIYNPPVCRGYIYVFIDLTQLRAGARPFLYLGSHGFLDDASTVCPQSDRYMGSGGQEWQHAVEHHDLQKFVVEVLHAPATRDDVFSAEQAWFNTLGCAYDHNFYNINPNAENNSSFTTELNRDPEFRRRFREATWDNPEFRKRNREGRAKKYGMSVDQLAESIPDACKWVWDTMNADPRLTAAQLIRLGAAAGVAKNTCGVQHRKWSIHQLEHNTQHADAVRNREMTRNGRRTNQSRANEIFAQHKPTSLSDAMLLLREHKLTLDSKLYYAWLNGGKRKSYPQRQYPAIGTKTRQEWEICDRMVGHRSKDILAAGVDPGNFGAWRRYYGYTRDNPPDPATHVVKLVRE